MFQDTTVRKVGIGVLILLAVFLLAKSVGEFKEIKYIGSDPALHGTIAVSGMAERTIKPDIARFTFSVTEEHLSVATAQERSAKKINEIIAYLKKEGIEEKDIKTSGYNVYPRYEYEKRTGMPVYYPEGERVLAGYTVTQTIEVKLRDTAKAGTILGGIGETGATDISSLWFEVDNQEEILEEVKQEAIKNAREKAEKLAKSLDVKLSRVINYSDGGYPVYARYEAMNQAYDTKASAGAAPSIPTGENLIRADVTVTYEIK